MRKVIPILLAAAALGVAGCNDSSTAPRDVTPPAAPRGLFSVTGDHQATLSWLANTESDVAGYRVYEAPCASGSSCPYDRIGATAATQFNATGLTNGVTRFFAISAVDQAGNESALSFEDVFDTPRPAGSTALNNFVATAANSGWDFSAFAKVSFDDPAADILYGNNGSIAQMFATLVLVQTTPDTLYVPNDIQDAGYASSLDAIDFSPVGNNAGWSPTGTVELIPGHCYIVWTWDDHYAKFRVTGISGNTVSMDWAYQTAKGNPELHARRTHTPTNSRRAITWLR
jgi:predicted small secreted protein